MLGWWGKVHGAVVFKVGKDGIWCVFIEMCVCCDTIGVILWV